MDVSRRSTVIVIDLASADANASSFEDLILLESTAVSEEGIRIGSIVRPNRSSAACRAAWLPPMIG